MKKTIALLSALTMLTGMGAMSLQANAYEAITAETFKDGVMYSLPLQASDKAGYDLFKRVDVDGINGRTGEYYHTYYDYYYKFGDRWDQWYTMGSPKNDYIGVSTDSEQTAEKVRAVLGTEADRSEDAELMYRWDETADYGALYQIDGVQKVERIRNSSFVIGRMCELMFDENDTWGLENGYQKEMTDEDDETYYKTSYGGNLLMSLVYTEPDVTLTPELLADTGYTVAHIYQKSEDTWYVYYNATGAVRDYYAFNDAVRQMDGVLEAELSSGGWFLAAEMETESIMLRNPIAAARADMNGNGEVDLADAAEILKKYAVAATTEAWEDGGVLFGDSGEAIMGDLDGDGQVTVKDADAALDMYAKIAAGLME